MKKTSKIAAIVMMLMLVLSMAGCGGSKTSTTEPAAPAAPAEKTYKVGICQLVQHDALDKSNQGFQDALKELLGDKVEFDYQNASGDSPVCATIANQFVASEYDMIFAIATPALQACANATQTIPVLATAITDFGVALDIDMGMNDPTGINVTGIVDLAPIDEQANQIVELFPDVAKVALLYCSAEANSLFQVDAMTEALAEKGVEAQPYSFTDSNDIQAVTTAAVEYGDLIWIPTDNTAASNGGIIANVSANANVPIVAAEESLCKSVSGVATLSISFYDIGYETGKMAYEVLVNGVDPSTMNIQSPAAVTPMYIPEVAETFGVEIPDNYEVLQ